MNYIYFMEQNPQKACILWNITPRFFPQILAEKFADNRRSNLILRLSLLINFPISLPHQKSRRSASHFQRSDHRSVFFVNSYIAVALESFGIG